MANYLVMYDLPQPGQKYRQLIKHLESYPTRWHCQQSVWIVGPAESARFVAERAYQFLDRNDKLLVQAVTEDFAWANYTDEKQDAFLRSA